MASDSEIATRLDTGIDPACPDPVLLRLLNEIGAKHEARRQSGLGARGTTRHHADSRAGLAGSEEGAAQRAPSDAADLLETMREVLERVGVDVEAEAEKRGITVPPRPAPPEADQQRAGIRRPGSTGGARARTPPPATTDSDQEPSSHQAGTPGADAAPGAPASSRAPQAAARPAINTRDHQPTCTSVAGVAQAGDRMAQAAFTDLLGYRARLMGELEVQTAADEMILDHALLNLARYHYFEQVQMTLLQAHPTRHLSLVERYERLGRRAEASFSRTLELLLARRCPVPQISVRTGDVTIDRPAAVAVGHPVGGTPDSVGWPRRQAAAPSS
ncbi:MAG: hypothetical protein HYY25_01145 [Candidatus Wallbacteria bacterium]|nr:hypothetical protein [Candidatus Wallbacteria bacterium]